MDNSFDLTEIYCLRTLVFLETEPQSNKYNQVLLNSEMFKKMTDIISKKIKSGEIEEREIKLSEEIYPLPDLPESYPKYD